MKRAGLFAPFVLLVLASFVSRWITTGHWLGNLWAASFLGCIFLVPVLARRKLWLGYAALLFPFVVLAVILALDWGDLHVGFG
jgi:hypothetical protein